MKEKKKKNTWNIKPRKRRLSLDVRGFKRRLTLIEIKAFHKVWLLA